MDPTDLLALLSAIGGLYAGVMGLLGSIARLTPSKKDDRLFGKLQKEMEGWMPLLPNVGGEEKR